MAGTHALDAHFEIISNQLRQTRSGRILTFGSRRERYSLFFSAGRAVSEMLFSLLERLKLCHAPRILSAECLALDTAATPGAIRQE